MDAETIERSIRKRLETAIAEAEHDFPIAGQIVLVRMIDGPATALAGYVVFAKDAAQ